MPTTPVARPDQRARPLIHEALLYRSAADYLAGVLPYLAAGLESDQPLFVAVPTDNLQALRDGLGDESGAVTFLDMTGLGGNPARIIPAIGSFFDDHPDRRARFVGEPIWSGRTPAEVGEATRHEAMLNLVFADVGADILCPYDVGRLEADTVADAWRTHPWMIDHVSRQRSPHYDRPEQLYADDADQLDAPPPDARTVVLDHHDLSDIRDLVRSFATGSGVAPGRTHDLVLAVNEIATNTLVHTTRPGTLTLWRDDRQVICEVRDSGHIVDPLAGRRLPHEGSDHGRGLWMTNQLCDLVQLRSTGSGTVVRMYVERGAT